MTLQKKTQNNIIQIGHNFEALDLEKNSSLFNLISQQPDIDKIYLYAKDSYDAKYQILINK